jgi:hypothetical protein
LILRQNRKALLAPRREVVFPSVTQPETGRKTDHVGTHDMSFLDFDEETLSPGSTMRNHLTSENIGLYWDLDEKSVDDPEDDNNSDIVDENSETVTVFNPTIPSCSETSK